MHPPLISDLHHLVINRLLAAWVGISLIIGGGVAYVGLGKIDDQLAAQAAEAAARFSGMRLAEAPEDEAAARVADELVRWHFIAVDVYNRDHIRVTRVMRPTHANLEPELDRLGRLDFPAAGQREFRKLTIAGENVLQVMLPLHDGGGAVSGYFEGFFVVDPATLSRLRRDMAITLGIVLCAVLLTAIAFYPVILSLNRDVMRYSHDLLKGNIELMETLGSAVAQRDSNTSLHNYRVTIYSVRLAEAVGLDRNSIRQLIAGAFLHDVGKIGISDTILLKPAKLSADEFGTMKTHVKLGVELLGKSPWLQRARDVVEFHHERFDGTGYPAGLSGTAIPVRARIFAIIDVFDALTSKRPYKEAYSFRHAMDILADESGRHFDPKLLASFQSIAEPMFREISAAAPGQVESMLRTLIDRYYFADEIKQENQAVGG